MHGDIPRQGDPVWIDWTNECVWRGSEAVRLTPKAYAVLRTLTARAGQLVSKTDLLQTVWPETVVSEGVLTGCIGELRKAFGETARAPQWIQTVHRRGYRFVGPLPRLGPGKRGRPLTAAPAVIPVPGAGMPPEVASRAATMVGRTAELAHLHQGLARALGGTRQVVFVTGEPGLGKTTLVQAFIEQVATTGDVWIAQGQCLNHYGAGEAYLPVLEALGQLCRGPGGAPCLAVLEQQAPLWLAQLPALCSAATLEALQRRLLGTTAARMLREMVDAFDALTQDRLLVLILEDLHWSDTATLDLLAALAQRPRPARLLILGTYRPVEVIVHHHPLQALKQELEIHRQCTELPLELLSAAEVAQYLAMRCAAGALPAASLEALARTLHQRTDGNPLFLVTLVDDLLRQGEGQGVMQVGSPVTLRGVPESLRRMITQQYDALASQDQQVVEAASVAGATYSVAAVAAGLEVEIEAVEARCAALARRGQFLEAQGLERWPDGTVTECYRWRHILYQEVIYDHVPAGRRLRLHQRIGRREETGYGAQAGARAAALADHFVRGHDASRAVPYLHQAAQNALRRYAYQEAIGHLTQGLEVLKSLSTTPERVQQELTMQALLGMTLMERQGYSAPVVERAYRRAHALCQQVGDSLQLFPVLMGLVTFYRVRAEYQSAWELMEQALRLAERLGDPALLVQAHAVLGGSCYYRGELSRGRTHLEQGLALYTPEHHPPLTFHFGVDPGVECYDFLARSLWYLGYPEQARRRADEALTLAQARGHLPSMVMARQHAGTIFQLRREALSAHTQAEAAVALATEHALPYWRACGLVVYGWARAIQSPGATAVTQIRQGLADLRTIGTRMTVPYFLGLLAEACGQAGLPAAGLAALAEAFTIVHQTGERSHEAELYRLQGELFVRAGVRCPEGNISTPDPSPPSPDAAAEACFHQALAIARHQQAKSLELRATVSLARLWQQQDKRAEAHELLAPMYGWFTEGFETADLQEARALLDELA
jgi:predicted ATPase/DNA-binding winged helix-turn-helix (wHTH) protein